MPYTITEALAEIKQIDSKINKKRDNMVEFVARQDGVKDPLAKDGGSAAFVEAALQSVNDLSARKIGLRTAINKANLDTPLTIGDTTLSVAQWIIWRRECAPVLQQVYGTLANRLAGWRKEAQQKGWATVKPGEEGKAQTDIIINVDEVKLLMIIEKLAEKLGTLDGKLSLHNAITTVEVL